MVEALRTLTLDIDLAALRHNLAVVTALAGDREVIASIKANAYGFGVVGVSRALVEAGVRKLWTGNQDEAIALREAGIDAEILLFGGPEPDQFETLLRYDLQPTIFDDAGLDALAKAATATGKRAPAWIKVDAGLGRLGVRVDEALGFIARVAATPEVELRGVYSHLPFGSGEGKDWAREHYEAFTRLIAAVEARGIAVPVVQIWGSSGLLAELPDISNAVCVGHALFGLNPLEPGVGAPVDLKPIIHSLSASILRVDQATAGGGYGGGGNGLGATVAIGLGDGLRKAIQGKGHVIVGEKRVPIRAFTLEHLMIDVSDTARPNPNDRALVIGNAGEARITLDDWAEWTGATPLEVMMSLSGRTPVSYRDALTA